MVDTYSFLLMLLFYIHYITVLHFVSLHRTHSKPNPLVEAVEKVKVFSLSDFTLMMDNPADKPTADMADGPKAEVEVKNADGEAKGADNSCVSDVTPNEDNSEGNKDGGDGNILKDLKLPLETLI